MIKTKMISKAGFSILEIVVVIAIMGIVSVVSIPTISTMLMNNRDSKRIADLEQISNSLEQFRSNNDVYPFPDISLASGWNVSSNIQNSRQSFSGYLKTIPTDPISGTNCPGYLYATQVNAAGKIIGYTLFARLENTTSKAAAATKPTPNATPHRKSGNSGNKIYIMALDPLSTCGDGVTFYNYWINNP